MAKRKQIRVLPASYSPGGKPICQKCWSNPDIDWAAPKDKAPSKTRKRK